jgi:hypothetical protein
MNRFPVLFFVKHSDLADTWVCRACGALGSERMDQVLRGICEREVQRKFVLDV